MSVLPSLPEPLGAVPIPSSICSPFGNDSARYYDGCRHLRAKPGQNFVTYSSQMMVTNSSIVFGMKKSRPTVAVIGTVKNLSPVPRRDVYFHVDFLNSAGKLTDSRAKEDYEYYLPANDTVSYKLSFTREFPETNYVKIVVCVVGAKDARSQW